jgi:hypothetical protein
MQYGKLYKVHNKYLCRIQKSFLEEQKVLTQEAMFDMLKKVGLKLRFFSARLSASDQFGDQAAVMFGLLGEIPKDRAVDRVGRSKLPGTQPLQCVIVAVAQRVVCHTAAFTRETAAGENQDAFETVLLIGVFLKERTAFGQAL